MLKTAPFNFNQKNKISQKVYIAEIPEVIAGRFDVQYTVDG